jgi:hypothetical protein
MSYVKTPSGLIMHASNHQALVRQAEALGLKNMLAIPRRTRGASQWPHSGRLHSMLVPAVPLEPSDLFGATNPDDKKETP